MIKQILPTNEYDIHIPQLHYTEIAIIGEIHIDQQATQVTKIAIKQEWEIIEECPPTRTHFLKLPQEGVGIYGTIITEGEKSLIPPNEQPCPAQSAPARAAAPQIVKEVTEIHHVSFKKCDCAPVAAIIPPPAVVVEPISVEHTTITPVSVPLTPVRAVAPPVAAAAADEKAGMPWWIIPLILLGLLLCLLLLCCLFCGDKKK
jgi:hypothetical protein